MHPPETQSTSQPEQKRSIEAPSPPPKPAKIPRAVEEEEGGEEEQACSKSMNPKPGVQRYLVAVEYIGTRFCGSQQQPNRRTVVGVLEDAFEKFVGQPVSMSCSSRTDAGVHALSNVCHVDVERISKRKPGQVLPAHEPGVVRRAVNHFLQNEDDIAVVDVRCVPADFHARFKAQERTYFYRLLSGPAPLSVLERERGWHVPEELDISAMQKACSILVGTHDFSSFRAAGCQAKSPVKTLDELQVSEIISSHFPSSSQRAEVNSLSQPLIANMESGLSSQCSCDSLPDLRKCNASGCQEFGQRKAHRCFVITSRARSFLYHQIHMTPLNVLKDESIWYSFTVRPNEVRLIVGLLKSVGTGELEVNDVERILNAKTVTANAPMAPACGLYLAKVKYDLP